MIRSSCSNHFLEVLDAHDTGHGRNKGSNCFLVECLAQALEATYRNIDNIARQQDKVRFIATQNSAYIDLELDRVYKRATDDNNTRARARTKATCFRERFNERNRMQIRQCSWSIYLTKDVNFAVKTAWYIDVVTTFKINILRKIPLYN